MWHLIVLTAALAQQHPADFRAGWERTKARTALWERHRHGLIDAEAYLREQAKLLTAQEAADFWKWADERARASKSRNRERERLLNEAAQAVKRWKAGNHVGPPPPPKSPDME